MPRVALVIVAHADDAEFTAGGTIAKLVDEGYAVYEVIATNNERGSFELDRETLIRTSAEEARRAAKVLGMKEVIFLNYRDGELSDVPLNELREKFMKIIRQLKPGILMTWDPWVPFENHQDHRMVAMAATEAADFSHFPLFHSEHQQEGLEPHYVAEKYFFAKNDREVDKVVDITGYIDKKIEALLQHDCQMKLTIDDLMVALHAAGVNPDHLQKIDRNNYGPLVTERVKAYCRNIGRKIGVEYAEEFRYKGLDRLAETFTSEEGADGPT